MPFIQALEPFTAGDVKLNQILGRIKLLLPDERFLGDVVLYVNNNNNNNNKNKIYFY